MSTADQILGAKIAAVAARHASRGRIDDLDQAVAELRQVAADRPDLLAMHAGLALGLAEVDSLGSLPIPGRGRACNRGRG